MATGHSFIRSVDKGSDSVYEFTCTRCEQAQGHYVEATHYCPECDVFYCKSCLQHVCDHGILGKAKMNKWGRASMTSQGEECAEHPGNMIQLYCDKHDAVCCHICVPLYHKSCDQMKYILKIVSGKDNKTTLHEVQKGLKGLQSRISKLQKDRSSRKVTLHKSYDDLIVSIRDFRTKINNMLDDLEKQTMNEVNEQKRNVCDKLQADSQTCDNLNKEASHLQKKLQTTNTDENILFIRLNKGKEWVTKNTTKVSELENTVINAKLPLHFHSLIETTLKKLQGLGKLVTNDLDQQQSRVGPTSKPMAKGHGSETPLATIDRPYKVHSKRAVNVKVGEDHSTCFINSICQLTNGSFVISDYNNKCLKQLDTTYHVTNRCALPDNPYSVCEVNEIEVVTALYNKTIQIVSVGTTMATTHSISLKHNCTGVAHHSGKLYITDWKKTVYVYSLTGTCLQTFTNNKYTNKYMYLYFAKYLVTSPDGTKIHVIYTENTMLITFDRQGKELATFSSAELRSARHVCVDGVGNLFVCGNESNNVLQVAVRGDKKIADIILPSDGINKPRALCFDRFNSRLLVFCDNSDTLHVIDIIQ